MIRILGLCCLLLLSAIVGSTLPQNPGYVFIAISHWTIETSLPIALLLLALLFLAIQFFLYMFQRLSHAPSAFSKWRQQKYVCFSQAKMKEGFLALYQGNFAIAKQQFQKALPYTDTPELLYLAQARCAQALGETTLVETYLQKAQKTKSHTKTAIKLTQAVFKMENRQYQEAIPLLQELQLLAPKHPFILQLLVQAYRKTENWPAVLSILPLTRKALHKEAYEDMLKEAYEQLLTQAFLQPPEVIKEMQRLPSFLKEDLAILSAYCTYLIKHNETVLAENILYKALQSQYNETLVALYGSIYVHKRQLDFAQTLLAKNPQSPAILLCLGRLNKTHQLWGKAKNYLERSISIQPSVQAYQELGELYLELQEEHQACLVFQKGLHLCK